MAWQEAQGDMLGGTVTVPLFSASTQPHLILPSRGIPLCPCQGARAGRRTTRLAGPPPCDPLRRFSGRPCRLERAEAGCRDSGLRSLQSHSGSVGAPFVCPWAGIPGLTEDEKGLECLGELRGFMEHRRSPSSLVLLECKQLAVGSGPELGPDARQRILRGLLGSGSTVILVSTVS